MPLPKLELAAVAASRLAVEPPPPPSAHQRRYALTYDEARGELVYVCSHDYFTFGDAAAFDGTAWRSAGACAFKIGVEDHPLCAFFDPTRGGTAIWLFETGKRTKQKPTPDRLAAGLLWKGGALERIATSGALPERGEDSDSELCGVFGFDRRRGVTVCVTARGVWELSPDAVWAKRSDGEGLLPKELTEGTAAHDARRGRVVFFLGSRGRPRPFSWDGSSFAALSADGLPDACLSWCNLAPAIVSHPEHGVLVHCGDARLHAPRAGGGWGPVDVGAGVPQDRLDGELAFDPARGLLVVGPGEVGPADRRRGHQHLFDVWAGGAWQRHGRTLEKLSSGARDLSGLLGGDWYVATERFQVSVLRDGAWVQLVDEARAAPLVDRFGGLRGVVGAGELLLGIADGGAVLRLDASGWTHLGDGPPKFGDREGTRACWDPARGRLVVWGGALDDKPSNDTFFFDPAARSWTAAPRPTHRPKGLKDIFQDVVLFFDTALGRVVRVEEEHVSVLDGETWKPFPASEYLMRLTFHDPRTGETLVYTGKLARFDPAGATDVAELALPREVGTFDTMTAFDPRTRTLHVILDRDRDTRLAVDLGPAFDAAAALGPRWKPDGFELAGARPPVAAAPRDPLAVAGLPARELLPGGEGAELGWVGGTPAGVAPERWPHGAGGAPLAFLLQVSTAGLLQRHAAVAVFCPLGQELDPLFPGATRAVLLSPDAVATGASSPPAGAPSLPRVRLAAGAIGWELDPHRAEELAEEDPALEDAFERLVDGGALLQARDKQGGFPDTNLDVPVVGIDGDVLLLQLDLESPALAAIRAQVSPAVGGTLFVRASRDETEVVCWWEYD